LPYLSERKENNGITTLCGSSEIIPIVHKCFDPNVIGAAVKRSVSRIFVAI
jgi:hypothetical protein